MNKEQILQDVCKNGGCVWAVRNKRVVKNKIGTLNCYFKINPLIVLEDAGCTTAAIKGPLDHIQGGDLRFGVMKKDGFVQNEDYVNPPANHPIRK